MSKSQVILNGKLEAEKIVKLLNGQIAKMKVKPGLAVILVGGNKASETYVKIKEKRADELGIYFEKYILSASVSEKKILDLIQKLNKSKKIHGIFVQLPLPKKFDTQKIIQSIKPKKDVDGFLLQKQKNKKTKKHIRIVPPTIAAVLHLIKISNKKLTEEKAIILANSLEFAEPLKKELEKKKIKVSIKIKPKFIRLLDYQIIIIALGKKHFLKPNMIKKDAIIIDVGITRQGGKIFGDVDPLCFKKSKYISPVPGGVGPLTVAFLLKNLVKLAKII